MKTTFTILMLSCSFIFHASAQEKSERPADIKVSDYDAFKNTSFDIQEQSLTLKESIMQLDTEIKTYSGVMNTLTKEKLVSNFKMVRDGIVSYTKLTANITELLPQGSTLLDNAKSISPKTKSPAAISNTNKSIKALNVGKENLNGLKEILEANLEILKGEMTNRGEIIE